MSQINEVVIFSQVIRFAERREFLGKQMNTKKLECDNCGTRQIQLVSYIDCVPAKWKCRLCAHKFYWEPKKI